MKVNFPIPETDEVLVMEYETGGMRPYLLTCGDDPSTIVGTIEEAVEFTRPDLDLAGRFLIVKEAASLFATNLELGRHE